MVKLTLVVELCLPLPSHWLTLLA